MLSLCMCVCVHVHVCVSHAGIESKWINVDHANNAMQCSRTLSFLTAKIFAKFERGRQMQVQLKSATFDK